MTPATAPSRRGATRARKKQTLSTSEARANFADALGLAQEENTVIGFERYGKLVAAVVSIDAVKMLAGRGDDVEPSVRGKIARMSEIFLMAAPLIVPKPAILARKVRSKVASKRRKDKRKKTSKPAAAKRHRRVSRKI